MSWRYLQVYSDALGGVLCIAWVSVEVPWSALFLSSNHELKG